MNKQAAKNQLLRVEEIVLRLDQDDHDLLVEVAEVLNVAQDSIFNLKVAKRAIDSRNRKKVLFVYSVNAEVENTTEVLEKLEKTPDGEKIIKRHRIRIYEPFIYEIQTIKPKKDAKRPVVVGTGPAGLFAALILAQSGCRPLVLERGKKVDARVKDIKTFYKNAKLNTESNIQFGEGGAGTFSDGKLNTLITNHRIKYVFDEFVEAGAPDEIIWNAQPHIGTDKLRNVVSNMRNKIIEYGGEFKFESCLTNIKIEKNKIVAVEINNEDEILVDDIIIAIGHSARDTYKMLYENRLDMESRPFSIGVRIEHKAEMINRAQYHSFYNNPKLPTARYKLVSHSDKNRPVYTFCMCPGGVVVGATSEDGHVVTNGMSEFAQDNKNSNSALLVNVNVDDFESNHPLAGIEFQRTWERQAFELGGSDFKAPAQLVGDFLNNKKSTTLKKINATYLPGVKLTSLDKCLPEFVVKSLQEALPVLDRKIKGFAGKDAVLTGVETRSSSPVRILRDDSMQSNILGIYPAGEGSGYSSGIISSAVDGLRVAEELIKKYQ